MIGYVDFAEKDDGLMTGATKSSWSRLNVKWLTILGAVGTIGLLWHVGSTRTDNTQSLVMLAAGEAPDPGAVCSTKPFGMCKLNITQFDPTKNSTDSCCPDAFHCVMFGPVFGMCMPGGFGTSDAALALATDASEDVSAAPCPTKPFEQCGGMNFTAPKLERAGYNFSVTAEPTKCCPPGTSCVSFGPVWAQCMPEWVAAVQSAAASI